MDFHDPESDLNDTQVVEIKTEPDITLILETGDISVENNDNVELGIDNIEVTNENIKKEPDYETDYNQREGTSSSAKKMDNIDIYNGSMEEYDANTGLALYIKEEPEPYIAGESTDCNEINCDENIEDTQLSANNHPSFSSILRNYLIKSNENEKEENLMGGEKDFTTLKNYKGTKKFKCEECLKMYTKSSDLQRHVNRVHREIRNFKCSECSKMFFDRTVLKIHEKAVHKDIRDYECKECHKTFSYSAYLKKHIRIVHKGIKKFQCNVCQKLYSEKRNLQTHINVTHGIKKYECNECHEMFSVMSILKSHINALHRKVVNECEECHKKFSHRASLWRHVNTHKKLKM